MPFLLAEILNFQGSTHRIGVGSFSYLSNFLDLNSIAYLKTIFGWVKRLRQCYSDDKIK